ncbi:hypothetical protein PB1_08307 [Bacillus methanolicus PB1]|uniref:Uncharacterized protein n=1 Tax=Bacillus methanolicus PB1 TaxID=997296 RepID=I3E1H8_BACMT|nr:hypothetical protein [Bacillus methanolicus]EIJ80349.1 hypothetical protein PB1_08307 [Bacillus methanolicus PB1]
MNNHDDWGARLEMLLESLIKMLGKTNEKVDDLNKRVHQLEWCMKNISLRDKDTAIFTLVKDAPNNKHEKTEKSMKKHYSITM